MGAHALGAAGATLRRYYLVPLGEVAFWKKVASGKLDFAASAATLGQDMKMAASSRGESLPQRVVASLAAFDGQVLVVRREDDLTAREFARLIARHNVHAKHIDLGGANQTFASSKWHTRLPRRAQTGSCPGRQTRKRRRPAR